MGAHCCVDFAVPRFNYLNCNVREICLIHCVDSNDSDFYELFSIQTKTQNRKVSDSDLGFKALPDYFTHLEPNRKVGWKREIPEKNHLTTR